ncbi:MAG TPA: hypothetical protein H9707_09625 [Candidatus Butyricicoccus avicola]|nr:hypothetical protein [Candidatus Butyricicoccus avicola]
MLSFYEIPFSALVHPRPVRAWGSMQCIDMRAGGEQAAAQLILRNPALQISLSKFDRMPGYVESIPFVSDDLEVQKRQQAQLSLLFERVVQSEHIHGFPVFEVFRLKDCARDLFHALRDARRLDALFLHFSAGTPEPYTEQPDSVRSYELVCETPLTPGARRAFLAQPWMQALSSNDVLCAALPAIEVPGWTIETLAADPSVHLLAGCVKHLYYCEFSGTPHFARQLRYAL